MVKRWKKRNKASIFLLSFAALLMSFSSRAVLIEYQLTDLGGGQFQYDYTVTNNSLAAGLEGFSVYFDVDSSSNLLVNDSPVDWDSIVFQPDPLLPDDGIFDTFYLNMPLALGETLGGFSVVFDWIGQLAPSEQFYDIFDINFDIVASGTTLDINRQVPVPEPSPLLLLGVGLLVSLVKFRSQRL